MKILQKGALSKRNKWRGLSLLSVHSKILAKPTIRWISEAVDQQLRQEQAGFRKGQGCTDQIFTLCNIIEQCTHRMAEAVAHQLHGVKTTVRQGCPMSVLLFNLTID